VSGRPRDPAPQPPAELAWADALAAWALPDELAEGAGRSPWGHDPALFVDRARRAVGRDLPGDRRAREALQRLGSVLDVGCGAGAAVVALGARGRRVTGVDRSAQMLAAFRAVTDRWWRRVDTAEGEWPDLDVLVHDVVVCHDVVYDVPGLGRFVAALTAHARRRVVIVLPERHPMSWLTPYFERLHGLSRPERPTADDALDVIRATGVTPHVERYRDPTRWGTPGAADSEALVDTIRWRLAIPDGRDDEIRAVVAQHPPPSHRDALAVWWEPPAARTP
jgi:SAM-dependent methyltransferase